VSAKAVPPTAHVTAHAANATRIGFANLKLIMFVPHEARSRACIQLFMVAWAIH
jgi:hypothetical protein